MRLLPGVVMVAMVSGAANAQCPAWQAIGSPFNATVRALASYDPTNSGHPLLVAGGDFSDIAHDYVAAWDGIAWRGLGWGTDGPVHALVVWDPGTGPQLIAAGDFTHVGADSTGELPAPGIASWDGQAWHPLPALDGGPINALTVYDRDGTGPQPPLLIAGGGFHGPHDYIAAWDGSAWQDLGWGFDGPVRALTIWQPIAGAFRIVAVGDFPNAGADSTGQIAVNHIAYWTGDRWAPFAGGINASPSAVISIDLDGTGPEPPTVVVGTSAGVLSWSSGDWRSLHSSNPISLFGISSSILSLGSWDPDGSGPIPPQLYASGNYEVEIPPAPWNKCAGGRYTASTTDRWNTFGGVTENNFAAQALLSFDADGAGPTNPTLVAAAGNSVVSAAPFLAPVIIAQSGVFAVHEADTVTFSVSVVNAQNATFQWFRRTLQCSSSGNYCIGGWECHDVDTSLADGAYPDGVTITGVNTDTLTISHITLARAGMYFCTVRRDACNSATSSPQNLYVVPGSCTPDFNHDGSPGTDQDIEDFFSCLAGYCCPTCGAADFNGDGDIGTDADIESFFRVLAGGNC